jgi:hypothetical protein
LYCLDIYLICFNLLFFQELFKAADAPSANPKEVDRYTSKVKQEKKNAEAPEKSNVSGRDSQLINTMK